MAYSKLDAGFCTDEAILAIGNAAAGVFVKAIAWSNGHLTDGRVPAHVWRVLAAPDDPDEICSLLMREDLTEECDGGQRIRNFLKYNASSKSVKKKQKEARERVARSRERAQDVRANKTRTSSPVLGKRLSEDEGVVEAVQSLLPVPDPEQTFRQSFWPSYPRKVGRADALKAWRKLAPDARLVTTILDALSWQRKLSRWQEPGGQFIPHPATYLNARRWDDEQEPAYANGVGTPDYDRRMAVVDEMLKA